jgi:CRP-like cAMP-binding protein
MWPAHTTMLHARDLATAGFVLVDGSVLATRGSATQLLGPGAAIGHVETNAALPYGTTIETTTPVRALRSGAPAIHDVLEDHTDVALAMVATFAGALLDAAVRLN